MARHVFLLFFAVILFTEAAEGISVSSSQKSSASCSNGVCQQTHSGKTCNNGKCTSSGDPDDANNDVDNYDDFKDLFGDEFGDYFNFGF